MLLGATFRAHAPRFIFLGVGGSGMSGFSQLLADQGCRVLGTDTRIDELRENSLFSKISLVTERALLSDLTATDCVIYSDAITEGDPLRQRARELGCEELQLHEAISHYGADARLIAVAGTHGKSSTVAFLMQLLIAGGLDPTVLGGAPLPGASGRSSYAGTSDILLVEADEFSDHFLHFHPWASVVTTLDFDHPDFFESLAQVKESFTRFISGISAEGILVMPAQLADSFTDSTLPEDTVLVPDFSNTCLPTTFVGAHMWMNVRLAIALAQKLGVPDMTLWDTLSQLALPGRRLETLGVVNDVEVISDYGHHPSEITETLAGFGLTHDLRKTCVLLEPHTFNRLEAFHDAFLKVLVHAHPGKVLLLPVYRARAESLPSTDLLSSLSRSLLEAGIKAQCITFEDLGGALQELSGEGFTQVIAFSAGVLDRHLRDLV